ncbi:hypothetical protein IAT38_003072 [Cryptococcus sp. DSM 104549]
MTRKTLQGDPTTQSSLPDPDSDNALPADPADTDHHDQPNHPSFRWTLSNILSTILYPISHFLASHLTALLGLMGLAHYTRDIVKILPNKPGVVRVRVNPATGRATGTPGDDVKETTGEQVEERSVVEWVTDSVPSLKGTFTPASWLPNGHLQTLFTVTGDFTKIDRVHYIRTYLRLPDGGTIGIDETPEDHGKLPADAPTVVVCHGLTGGSHESYVRNILSWVIKPKSEGGLGGRGVVVNFRGCAGVPVTSCQFYSAGTTMDLALALHFLRTRHPHSPFHGLGFSLGASVLSRYVGEVGSSSLLSSGTVLGCPWDLAAMSHKLENDWFTARVYSSSLGKNVLRLFFRAYDKTPELFNAPGSLVRDHIKQLEEQRKTMGVSSRLRNVDDVMVCKIGGPTGIGAWPFPSAQEYYEWASPRRLIGNVKVPLLAINAFDDPVVDGAALPLTEFHASSHVYTAVTGSGGHLGWFDGPFFDKIQSKRRWVLKPVSEFLTAAARDLPLVGRAVEVEIEVEQSGEKGEEKWEWVKTPAHEIPGLKRIGWRVLDEGEVVKGESDQGEEGLVQGL